MNAAGRAVLIDAAMQGKKQIQRATFDTKGGACVLGRLMEAQGFIRWDPALLRIYGMDRMIDCPMDCGYGRVGEGLIVVHLNDDHGFDYLTIANKLPDSEVAL